MANSTYQISSTPKLYISFPLQLYSRGNIFTQIVNENLVDSEGNLVIDLTTEYRKLLQLNPADWVHLDLDLYTDHYKSICFTSAVLKDLNTDWWNFDFFGTLGHDFNRYQMITELYSSDHIGANQTFSTPLETENIINHNPNDVPDYDGFSLMKILNYPSDPTETKLNVVFKKKLDDDGNPINMSDPSLGSYFFGKSYEFPQNAELSTEVKFDYGVKQKQTLAGKTLSYSNWNQPNTWGKFRAEPFSLHNFEEVPDNNNVTKELGRTGRRTWTMEFSSLASDKVMPQNMMLNDNNYTLQDNHEQGAETGSSKYNIMSSPDFFSRVVSPLSGSHLPCVLQIDKNDNSPSNFAIVRMNKDYVIKQKSPNLYTIKCSFTEQI